MKVSDRRIAEWWEAPGIDGRDGFDEEILYLNSLAEEIPLPRWAILVRDRMPRWGFEPCAHRFLDGLEQVLHMISSGRPCPRFGGCGDIPLAVQRELDELGSALLRWADRGDGEGRWREWLGTRTPERAEAVRALGEAVHALGRGPASVDAVLERWADRAEFPLTRTLVADEAAPLPSLARHPCTYTLLLNIERVARSIGDGGAPEVLVCLPALRAAQELDPNRISVLRNLAEALAQWLRERRPRGGFEERVHALIDSRDDVRRWLVASLYKTIKLWLVYLDEVLGEEHEYLSLI